MESRDSLDPCRNVDAAPADIARDCSKSASPIEPENLAPVGNESDIADVAGQTKAAEGSSKDDLGQFAGIAGSSSPDTGCASSGVNATDSPSEEATGALEKPPTSERTAPRGVSSHSVRRPHIGRVRIRMRVHTFDSFGHRSFLLLWLAMLFFSSGYWLQQIVVGWLTYEVTGSALWTSLALSLEALPILFVGPVGGVLVDRFDRKRLLAGIYGYQATLTIAFAAIVLTGQTETWHIFAYIFLMGLALVVSEPARTSLIANIVPKENLINAFALSSLAFSLPRLGVPVLGGLIIVLAGPGVALALEGGLQLCAVVVVMGLQMSRSTRPAMRLSNVFADVVDGVRYISREPALIGLFALISLPALLVMPSIQGLLPVYAAEVFQVDARGLGLLMSSAGAGSILGTLILATKGDFRSKNMVVLASMCVMAMATGIFSINVFFPTAYVNLIIISAAMMISFSISSAIIHSTIADEYRGRVAGLFILPWGLLPLGSLASGFLAERLGAPHATQITSGIMIVLLCLVIWRIKTLRKPAPASQD